MYRESKCRFNHGKAGHVSRYIRTRPTVLFQLRCRINAQKTAIEQRILCRQRSIYVSRLVPGFAHSIFGSPSETYVVVPAVNWRASDNQLHARLCPPRCNQKAGAMLTGLRSPRHTYIHGGPCSRHHHPTNRPGSDNHHTPNTTEKE